MALLHVDFFSDVLGMCSQMDVILPEQTRGQIGMEGKRSDGKYPTLYLLHGMSDDHTIWQRRTSIERYAADYGIAVVMPTTQLGWYTDMHIGYKWWTFLSQELPAICRTFFPNMSSRREDTFAAGLSMGGYGALKCGLLAPETFGAVASLSGGDRALALRLQNKYRALLKSHPDRVTAMVQTLQQEGLPCVDPYRRLRSLPRQSPGAPAEQLAQHLARRAGGMTERQAQQYLALCLEIADMIAPE